VSTDLEADVLIVGAGVIGLACAALLARAGRSVVVLERNAKHGQETSSRNSGVIHAGLYYPSDSLKAQLCVRGRELLYARCSRLGIAHRKLGKLLVAVDDAERDKLAAILERGRDNGAGAVRMLDAREVHALEPRVRAIAGLLSPESGIVDVHALMDSYKAEGGAFGAVVSVATELVALEPRSGGGFTVTTARDGARQVISARAVVNAAGLFADRVAELAGAALDEARLRLRPCKGDYFALAPRLRGLVSRLVYPVPVHAGLGIHVTLDLGGKLTAGPDAQYVEHAHYAIDANKARVFGTALRRYLPDVRDDDLSPDYAGVRPKLQGPSEPFRDFAIVDGAAHGAPGLISLIGIESPGLTASEAIAERVVKACCG
jgi:L-2-hydroxyglutarate oxidase LhgO